MVCYVTMISALLLVASILFYEIRIVCIYDEWYMQIEELRSYHLTLVQLILLLKSREGMMVHSDLISFHMF